MSEKFDPNAHLILLKNKKYLETKWRLVWFREDHPNGCITTEIVNLEPVLVKATVVSNDGTILGTGHAGAVDKGNAVWSGRAVEKSETAAIGRALAVAGYGTQFAEDDEVESGHLADSPVERKTPQQQLGNGDSRRAVDSEDLRDKDVASRFIQRWRGQALSDTDVLAALGVAKLSEWTKGRAEADSAVNAWLAGQLNKAGGRDLAAIEAMTAHHFRDDKGVHFKHTYNQLVAKGAITDAMTDTQAVNVINADRLGQGKTNKGWFNNTKAVENLNVNCVETHGKTLWEIMPLLPHKNLGDYASDLELWVVIEAQADASQADIDPEFQALGSK